MTRQQRKFERGAITTLSCGARQATADVMTRPDFLKRHLLDRGLEPIADGPEQAARSLAEDREIVKDLVKEIGLQPE